MEIANGKVTLHAGDCLEVLAALAENSIDAVVTDPPYELGFMGKSWDASGVAFCPGTWHKVLRVLKPGGHLVAFGAPKNYHRLACAIEDAGFEIRDSLMWVFGVGFPKSMDVSKAIDKAAGAEREKIAVGTPVKRMIPGADQDATGSWIKDNGREYQPGYELPATDAAREWQGWGTALKPAYEPIVLARKPLSEKTVAANVLRWGTGALNIDACRVGSTRCVPASLSKCKTPNGVYGDYGGGNERELDPNMGRWPANLCHDGSQGVLDLFPHTKTNATGKNPQMGAIGYGSGKINKIEFDGYGSDEGSAARFFYSAKASKQDRAGSKHPTVKPVSLMEWLVRMITPPGGTVLDPFAGTGTTGRAAVNEGFQAVLIEREEEYRDDIVRRFDV